MRILNVKKILAIAFLSTAFLIFNSCKKTGFNQPDLEVSTKVETWLSEQIASQKPQYAATIVELKKNLLLTHTIFEKLNDKEQLVVIPIDKSFVLRNNRNKPVTNYLLLILDENKKIRKGNIVQYLPENKATKSPIP